MVASALDPRIGLWETRLQGQSLSEVTGFKLVGRACLWQTNRLYFAKSKQPAGNVMLSPTHLEDSTLAGPSIWGDTSHQRGHPLYTVLPELFNRAP